MTRQWSPKTVMLSTLFPKSSNVNKALLSQSCYGWVRDRLNLLWDRGLWCPLPHICYHQQSIIMLTRRVIICRERYLMRQLEGKKQGDYAHNACSRTLGNSQNYLGDTWWGTSHHKIRYYYRENIDFSIHYFRCTMICHLCSSYNSI